MNNINKIITSSDQKKIDKLEKKATQLLEAKKRGRKTLEINADEFKESAKTLTIPELCLKFKCSPAKVANLKQKFQVKRKYLIDLDKVDQLLKNGDTIKEIAEKLGVKRTTLIASLHKLKNFKK
jgi:AraC-like DNA-binding protein